MRISKHEMYMELANVASKRSHDADTQVGAVLVNNKTGAVLATGCNGFIRGADDENLPTTRPEKYKYMVHAEENMIANCARHGISMDNCTLYCTMSPCVKCMRLLWQCGITSIIVRDLYRDVDEIKTMQDINLSIGSSEDHSYHVLEYSV
jgi:dCMP deaminase